MNEIEQELSPEKQGVISIAIVLAGGAFLCAFLLPIFDTTLAISFNHTIISLLPDSFEPLKFTSNESENFQKVQLIFGNLPLLPVVLSYFGSYIFLLATSMQHPPLKTVTYFLGIYCGFYAMGYMASLFLNNLS